MLRQLQFATITIDQNRIEYHIVAAMRKKRRPLLASTTFWLVRLLEQRGSIRDIPNVRIGALPTDYRRTVRRIEADLLLQGKFIMTNAFI